MPFSPFAVAIAKKDYDVFKGQVIRLKSMGNIKLQKRGTKAVYVGNELIRTMPKIQWVSRPHIHLTIITPDSEQTAIGEEAMKKLKPGDLIQMERIGFARIDKKIHNRLILYFTHP